MPIEVYDWCWAYGEVKFSNTPEDFNVIINNYVDSYNKSIPVLVDKLQDEEKNVEFADIYSFFEEKGLTTDEYLEDGVHPNEKGYKRIGLMWYANIKNYLNIQNAIKEIDATAECPYRVADLVSLSNYVIGRTNHQITKENYSLYDVNGDGVLDSFDLGLLRQLFIEKNMKIEKVQSSNSTGSTISKAVNTAIAEIDDDDDNNKNTIKYNGQTITIS